MPDGLECPHNGHHAQTDGAAQLAEGLFRYYADQVGRFPLFWRCIEYRLERLTAIFDFFFSMRRIDGQRMTELKRFLRDRLINRFEGDARCFPTGLEEVIAQVSAEQVAPFEQLGDHLLQPAFDLFTSGTLMAQRHVLVGDDAAAHLDSQPSEVAPPPDLIGFPIPDNASFFLWAEFAFVAAGCGRDKQFWKRILPVLLRAERIYILAYGSTDRTHRTFETYTKESHQPVHPDQVECCRYPGTLSFDQLDRVATECVRDAFPAGLWPNP